MRVSRQGVHAPTIVLSAVLGLAALAWTPVAHGGGAYLTGPQGPYSGRVVDAATGRPIPGAGVFMFWEHEDTGFPGVFMELAQREILTNEHGEFLVDAGAIETNLPPRSLQPEILIFKPGYRHYPRPEPHRTGAPARLFAKPGVVVRLQPVKSEEERFEAASELFAATKPHHAHGPILLGFIDTELKRLVDSRTDWRAAARRPASPASGDQPCVTDPARISPPPPGGWPPRTPGGLYLEGHHGPYRGRVVDAETGQPIRGAVVFAVWTREIALIIQTNTYFFEACEALTGENGEFVIDARAVETSAPSTVRRAYFEVFFPGYSTLRRRPQTERGFASGDIEQGGASWGLVRLVTREQRLQVIRSIPGIAVPPDKVPNVIRLLNVERAALGLDPVSETGER